jgi:serine/threonine protein kinase
LGEFESLQELVRQCLEIDPNRRINCATALRHRFFQ